jgi:hypothetical protein
MQAIHGQFQGGEEIVFQTAEVGGQQQLAITGGGELVIDTQIAACQLSGRSSTRLGSSICTHSTP